MKNIKLSALNLVPIREGQEDKDAINDMVTLAQALDDLDYERYWIAEHHNAPNLVSSATSINSTYIRTYSFYQSRFWRHNVTESCTTSRSRTIWDIGNIIPSTCGLRIRTCSWYRYDDSERIKKRSA